MPSVSSSPSLAASPEPVAAVRTLGRLARLVERVCQETGLSLPQYRVLTFIADGRHMQRAGELAGRASVSRPTLTALVDGLERHGLLTRCAVEGDRRGTAVEITSQGREAIAAAERLLIDRVGELVPAEHAQAFTDALVAVGQSLDAKLAEKFGTDHERPAERRP